MEGVDLSGEQTYPKQMNKICLKTLWATCKHRSCSNNLCNNDNLWAHVNIHSKRELTACPQYLLFTFEYFELSPLTNYETMGLRGTNRRSFLGRYWRNFANVYFQLLLLFFFPLWSQKLCALCVVMNKYFSSAFVRKAL